MADMYSWICFVYKMLSAGATSAAVISKMKEIFAEHGVPDILRSDNGSQYASAAFTEFIEEWGFQHTTSSLHYPASNGFVETMVKIIKTSFTKYSCKDPQLTLLALHSTLVGSHLLSPVPLLYPQKLKTRLPTQPSNTDEHLEHAPAATSPRLVPHQCITPSKQPQTPAKAGAANIQYNQSVAQSSTEPKVLAPSSVPATKVPTSLVFIPQWQNADQATPTVCQNA